MINPANFLTINEILADVLVHMGDEDTRLLTKGFYTAQCKKALDELGFDTFFNEVVEDIALPIDLRVTMPTGAYDLKMVKIYKGDPTEIREQQNVYWKRNYQSEGQGTGYTANVHHMTTTDPFIKIISSNRVAYFFNVQNGIIMLSDPCQNFDYVRLTYSGVPSKTITDVKIIPPEVANAVTLWTIERCAGALKIRDGNYRVVQTDAAIRLDEYGLNGAMHQAKARLRKLDRKMMQDVLNYWSEMNY